MRSLAQNRHCSHQISSAGCHAADLLQPAKCLQAAYHARRRRQPLISLLCGCVRLLRAIDVQPLGRPSLNRADWQQSCRITPRASPHWWALPRPDHEPSQLHACPLVCRASHPLALCAVPNLKRGAATDDAGSGSRIVVCPSALSVHAADDSTVSSHEHDRLHGRPALLYTRTETLTSAHREQLQKHSAALSHHPLADSAQQPQAARRTLHAFEATAAAGRKRRLPC